MALYFLSFCTAYAFVFIKQANKPAWLRIYVVLLCLFLCFGYMTGTDWRAYEEIYTHINFNNLFYNYFQEPGYYIYMLPFRFFNIDFFVFFIFTKVLCYISIINKLITYCEQYRYIGLMYFIPCWGFYLFIDNPMRNLIAASISVFAFKYLLERKPIPYFSIVILAMTFHATACVMIPAYFFLHKNLSTKKIVILYAIINILFANRTLLTLIICNIFGFIPYVEGKINSYIETSNVEGGGRTISLGFIIFFTFFVLLCIYKNQIYKMKNGIFIWNGAITFLLLYRLATTIEVFMRFQIYYVLFFVAGISILTSFFTERSKKIYITYLLGLAIIGSSQIFATWRYLPYTNYLTYALKGEFPSYSFRSAYNPNNSPYKTTNKGSKK